MKQAVQYIRLFALFGIFAICAFSQTAQVTGTVVDPTGAVVVGAKVVATNIDTGVARDTVTNGAGNYLITALLPGAYRVSSEATGFKQIKREPITLAVDQVARIDFKMEVGESSQSVTVESSAILLDAATSTVGNVVENQRIAELPLNGRDPIDLLALSTGIRIQGGFGGQGSSWGNFSSNGGLANANVVMTEGLALDLAQMNSPSFVPTADSTQEFRAQTSKFSAEYGRTAGAVINFSIKSGTNDLHGSAYEYLRNKNLNANNFFSNRAGRALTPYKRNQFGATIGGPIKKDKAFYFFNWEDYTNRQFTSSITTVPTPLQRAGNFSQTLNAAGSVVAVADALTSRQVNGVWTRDVFSGNIIPLNRINPVAAAVTQVFPAANAAGNPGTGLNNYGTVGGSGSNQHEIVTKLDYNLNARWKLFGTYARTWSTNTSIDPLGYKVNLTRHSTSARTHATVSATAVFSPTLIGDFHTGFARLDSPSIPYALGYDITQLGFPAALANDTQIKSFPAFNIAGLVAVGSTSSAGFTMVDLNSWGQRGTMTWVKGSHTVKFGGDYRVEQLNQFQQNSLEPAFQFDQQMTAINPLSLNANSGLPLASFLMGYMASASAGKSERMANERKYLGVFFQDDWKATRKLTLNLGMEYSLEFPITERYNRKMWFDPTVALPISQQVGLNLTGGFKFADNNTRSPYDVAKKQFGPRVGFAYQLFTHTVIRSGYGLFWIPAATTEVTGNVRAPAWSISTQAIASLDNGITPYNTLSNPFPQGILNPPGSAAGLNTLIGQNAAANQRSFRAGYMQQFNFDIQHEFGREMVLEVLYGGSVGTGLPANWASQMNQLPDTYLSQGASLQALVPNPFMGVVTSGTLSLPTVQRGQLLRPWPQFQTLYVEGNPLGHSNYHSFQLQFNKRFGSSVIGLAYTISKAMGDTESRTDWSEGGAQGTSMGFMDPNNRRLDRSLAVADVPQRLVFNFVVEVPLGKGRRMLDNLGPLDRVVSGWQLTGLYTAQSGTPVAVGTPTNLTGTYNAVTDVYGSYSSNSRPNNNGQSAKLSGDPRSRLNQWFNTSVFSQPAPFTYGNTARTLPDARWDGTNNLDFGLFKNNKFGNEGRFNLQFRAEFFNLANHVRFGIAGMQFGNSTFGVVSSQGNSPRQIQLALRLSF